jgi:type II secretory pathway pseudopilin PulG
VRRTEWRNERPPRAAQPGFTYLYVMFVVAVMGASLAVAADFWQVAQQREKERELLFAGHQFTRAIETFRARNSGKLPHELQELLLDPNWPVTQRHLRKIYVDPMTGRADWTLIKDGQGGIVGIHSQSGGKPIKTANFRLKDGEFAEAETYAQWRFIANPPAAPLGQGGLSNVVPASR